MSLFFFADQFFLFGFMNRDLEKAVEDLSELLESPIEADNIPTLRQQVTNKTVCFFFHLILSSNNVLIIMLSRSTYTSETRLY